MFENKHNSDKAFISWLVNISIYGWNDQGSVYVTVNDYDFIDVVNGYKFRLSIENEKKN